MNLRRIAFGTAAVLALLCGDLGQANADPIISVGTYTPSTTMPFVVPIDIAGAMDLTSWQLDVAYDATDVQIVTSCDPFSDIFCNFSGTGITEGPFFGSLSPFNVFDPGFILLDPSTLAQMGQLIAVTDTFGGPLPGPSGDGVLAYIEFVTTATGTGTSTITVNGGSTSSVPEPGTVALVSCGLLLLLGAGPLRRRDAI